MWRIFAPLQKTVKEVKVSMIHRGVAAVSSATLIENSLRVQWADGREHAFHLAWLRDNCRCPTCVSTSGQKTPRTVVPDEVYTEAVNVIEHGAMVTTKWVDHSDRSSYTSDWLRNFAYCRGILQEESASREARATYRGMDGTRHGVPIQDMPYSQLVSGDQGVFQWMSHMNVNGFCVIRGSPREEGTVKRVANLVGPVSHAIYGETFKVEVAATPINVAYSDAALESHMDLPYFESPPGIQLLHCIRFDELVKGGESTIIDSHAVAEELRDRDPEAFEVLCRVPATFQKDHTARENPVRMFYQRPHIQVNHLNDVVAVFWSPPFMGPLRVDPNDVEPYYKAYSRFRSLLHSKEMWNKYGCRFRLQPGDLLTFSNRRMLHGRDAFTSHEGVRMLQGCYLDVDTWLNKYRILSDAYATSPSDALGAPGEMRLGTSSFR